MLSCRTAARRAHLRSHSGRNAGVALADAPTTPECIVAPLLFRVLLLERLHLLCSCGATLDPHGKHRAACSLNGRLKKRAAPIERMVARIFREAGARVRFNARGPQCRRATHRVLAQDLPCFGGAQLAVDVTLRSPLRSTGEPHPNAADVNGAVLQQARRDKETTYPELVRSGRCRLVVLAMETGGRLSEETVSIIHQLAIARAREVPSYMSHQVTLAWERRWTRMLATTCAISFAASLWWSPPRVVSRGPTLVGWHPASLR